MIINYVNVVIGGAQLPRRYYVKHRSPVGWAYTRGPQLDDQPSWFVIAPRPVPRVVPWVNN